MPKIYRPVMPMRKDFQGKWVEVHDVSRAKKYGQLLNPIIPNQYYVNDYREDWILETLREGLAEFGNEDYLLLNGDPEILALSIFIAAEINDGRVKLLKWEKQHQCYIPRNYNLQERT